MNKVKNLPPKVIEALSAYIDGELSQQETRDIEARLASSVELQEAHERLKAMRAAVRALPRRKVPHNFILTRAEAAAAKRGRNWQRAFGLAFSLCLVFLVSLIGYDSLSQGLFSAKQAAIPEASEALLAADVKESSAIVEYSAPEEIEPRSMPEESPELAVVLNWSSPTEEAAMNDESVSPQSYSVSNAFASQPDTSTSADYPDEVSFGDGTEPYKLTEDGLLMVYVNAETGIVHICDPVQGCGLGGGLANKNDAPMGIQSTLPASQSGVRLVNPDYVYYDPVKEAFFLCEPQEGCINSEAASARQSEESSQENAFPLILGLDHENEGEVLSESPQPEEEKSAEIVSVEEPASEKSSADNYDQDADHQNYLRDNATLWLKIGLVGLTILFGIVWLIIRRR